MLSIAVLGVSGLPVDGAMGNEGVRRWSIRVKHGRQRCRTGHILPADLQQQEEGDAAAGTGPERIPSQSPWDKELEVDDKEGEERVEIAIVAEVADSRSAKKTESVRQWIAVIKMSTFRCQPDKRTTFWLPLRPVASQLGEPFGAIEMAVTYNSEDCVAHGYVFALFCGLVPVSWMDSFLSISPWGDMHQQNKITDRVWSHQTVPQKKGKTATSSIPTVAKGESSPESCAESAAPADTLTI